MELYHVYVVSVGNSCKHRALCNASWELSGKTSLETAKKAPHTS